MSLAIDGVWKAGVWATTVWADGVWREGDAPPPVVTVTESPTGGFFFGFDHAQSKRDRRKRELEEMAREQESIEDSQAREIANLMRIQEEKDAEREDLARIQALADQYAGQGTKLGLPKSVSTAILKAHEERSRNALEQVMREIDRMREEEEFALIAALMMD